MPSDADPRGPSRIAVAEIMLAVAVGAVGLLMAHHPMILSGLGLIQTDLGDTRLLNYVLEHSYLWVRSEPGHQDFWSPPFFYPARNVAAYSDVLLSVAPPYWGLRALGVAPDTAFQLWMIGTSGLNFLAGFLLFRLALGLGAFASSAGAFLIAFGAPRINQLTHPQLIPHFYTLMVLFALIRVFSDREGAASPKPVSWFVAALALVAQFYASFYLGWFLLLALGIAALWASILPGYRDVLLRVLRRDVLAILAAAATGLAAFWPLLVHALRASHELGPRYVPMVRMSIPQPWSWVYLGPLPWLWGWTAGLGAFRRLPMEPEHRIGIGPVTTLVCAAGLYLRHDQPLIGLVALVALGLFACVTYLPGDALAQLAFATVLVGAALAARERSSPRARLYVLAGIVALVSVVRFPSARVVALGLFTTTLCLAESFRERQDLRRVAVLVVVVLWLCSRLFALVVIARGVAVFAPLVVVAALALGPYRSTVVLLGLAALFVFLSLVTYLDRPWVLVIGLVAPPVFLAVLRGARLRPPPRLVATGVLAALPWIVLLEGRDSLWYYFYYAVPGGSAIRAVARAALVMLVLEAIGCAAFFAAPWARRRPILACVLALFCAAEQGATTPAFDKLANRSRIAQIASRVDDRCVAFYHRPTSGRPEAWVYHLDAMWASLARRVPTINGYSGGSPPGWEPLVRVDGPDGPDAKEALMAWIRSRRLPPDRVCRIDGD